MDDSFEEALDSHLAALGGREEAAEAAQQSTDHLDLAALLRTAEAISRVPRPGLSPSAARRIEQRLLERASELRPPGERRHQPAEAITILHMPARTGTGRLPRLLGLVATILVTVAVLGGGSVLAATDSLPSSLLYPLKIAGERAQLIMAQSNAGRAHARMLVAEHRLSEIEAIASSGNMVDESLVAALQEEINRALEEIERVAPQNSLSLLSRLNDIINRQGEVLQAILLTVPADDRDDFEAAAAVAQQHQQASARALARALKEQPAPVGAEPTAAPTVDEASDPSSLSGRFTSDRPGRLDDDPEARPTSVPSGTPSSAGPAPSQSAEEPERTEAPHEEDDNAAEHLPSAPAIKPPVRSPTAAAPTRTPTPSRAEKEDSKSDELETERERHEEHEED